MLREIIESVEGKVIFKGSKDVVSKVMDALRDYEEKHKFPYQGYYSYTDDHQTYKIKVDDLEEYKKHKPWIDKIIKNIVR